MIDVDIRESWLEFSKEIGGQYLPENIFKGESYPRVVAERNGFKLTLKAGAVPKGAGLKFTTVTGAFDQKEGFEFVVRTGGWFNGIDKMIAKVAGDIEVGHSDFDAEAWVAGKKKEEITELFNDNVIRETIQHLGTCLLAMEHDLEGYTISFVDSGADITCDKERLWTIFTLCWLTLDRIRDLGSRRA